MIKCLLYFFGSDKIFHGKRSDFVVHDSGYRTRRSNIDPLLWVRNYLFWNPGSTGWIFWIQFKQAPYRLLKEQQIFHWKLDMQGSHVINSGSDCFLWCGSDRLIVPGSTIVPWTAFLVPRTVDPDSRIWILHFKWIRIRIRIQFGSRVLMTRKWRKKIQQKFFYIFSRSKIAIYSCPNNRKSLQPSKENIQDFKKWNFLTFSYVCGSFLPSWIRIRIGNPDTDPGTPLNPDPNPLPVPVFMFFFKCRLRQPEEAGCGEGSGPESSAGRGWRGPAQVREWPAQASPRTEQRQCQGQHIKNIK